MAFLVALTALLMLPGQAAGAAGQPDLIPISVESVAEHVAVVEATYGRADGRLIYRTPDMDAVTIVNVTYDPQDDVTADLYYPPGCVVLGADGTLGPVLGGPLDSGNRLPVFILPMGFQLSHWMTDFPFPPRDHVYQIDTMAMFAAHGIVAVSYETERIDVGLERLLDFLVDHEVELGIDVSRVGLFSWSGHGRLAGKAIGLQVLADRLRCVVSFHSDIQVMTLPDRPLRFYVVHSGGDSWADQYGIALVRRMTALGHDVVEIADSPSKNFQFELNTPENRAIVSGAAEFARRWLVD